MTLISFGRPHRNGSCALLQSLRLFALGVLITLTAPVTHAETLTATATAPVATVDGKPLALNQLQSCLLTSKADYTATLTPAASMEHKFTPTRTATMTCTTTTGQPSAPVTVTVQPRTPQPQPTLTAPTNVRLAQPDRTKPALLVTWVPVPGAAYYDVQHNTHTVRTTGGMAYLNYTIPVGQCVNTGDTLRVRAVSATNTTSAYAASPAMPRRICAP